MKRTEIQEVNSKKRSGQFLQYPLDLYAGNKFFVPPLLANEKKILSPKYNPAFLHSESRFWLAKKDGKIAGRIGGIINHSYNEKMGKNIARFNWFDCIDDAEVAGALFGTVEEWAMEKGMNQISGPYGFNSFDKHGLLVDGFNELAASSSNYNYPYYQKLVTTAGYQKEADWVEYSIKVPGGVPDKMERVAGIATERYNLRVPEARSMKDLLPYKYEIFHLLNEAYRHLLGVVPLTEEETDWYVRKFFGYLSSDFVTVVLDQEDNLIAFGITMPSLSEALQKAGGRLWPFGFFHLWKALRVNDTIDLLLIAVKPEYQNKGINAILFRKLIPNFIRRGIQYVETTQNQEGNEKVQAQWSYFDHRLHKRSRCFFKEL